MDSLDSFQVDEHDDIRLIERLIAARQPAANREGPDLAQVRLLVIDFDGVMTDNRVLVSQDGHESVWCSRGDGLGITSLKEAGVEVIVLSMETNPVVAARCKKLAIGCVQGEDDKLPVLKRIVAERSLRPDQVAYVGNDVNDLECMEWVGAPIAVADAEAEVKHISRWVTARSGGRGAIREVCNRILSQKRKRSVG
jgi:N-acylneuraminate cytidylyltransferase